MSGYSRSIGPLSWEYTTGDMTAITDGVKNYLNNQPTHGIGTLNGLFDSTATSGLHVVANGSGVSRVAMIPIGIQAAPAQGDPVYVGQFLQKEYMGDPNNEGVYATVGFEKTISSATTLLYDQPWGWLLHAKGAETAVNTATGIDDNGGSSALGGYLVYQIFAGNGTGVIRVQDAATNLNASFADLSGATTGVISFANPTSGVVAIGKTATVRQFLRWQVTFTTSTSVTFALAFVRANR